MTNLNRTPPRLFSAWSRPRYPRTIGIGALLLASACGRTPTEQAAPDPAATGSGAVATAVPAGSPASVIEEAPVSDAAVEGTTDATVEGASDAAAETGSVDAARKPPPPRPPPPRPGGARPPPFHSED